MSGEGLVTNPVRHFFNLDTNDPQASLCGSMGPGDLVREVEANVTCSACVRALRIRQERCPECGQADNCGDCDHTPIVAHEGHGPGECRPGCPVFDDLPVEERAAQMSSAEMMFDLLVRMGGADYAAPASCGCDDPQCPFIHGEATP